LKKNNFDIEKGFNRTFSNKCKDSGIIQQEKGLADIDLNANDYFIIESLVINIATIVLTEIRSEKTRLLRIIALNMLD
jgi:hypothetical protein